jgi:hypothetical protein
MGVHIVSLMVEPASYWEERISFQIVADLLPIGSIDTKGNFRFSSTAVGFEVFSVNYGNEGWT